jgi:dolichol-phosphate mannosyltransferase
VAALEADVGMSVSKLSMVIPCYNEAEGAPALLDRLVRTREAIGRRYEWETICVDDGSRDGTAARLEDLAAGRLPLRIVRHERNRGLGAALRTGYAHATGDLIATADSDCTYDPLELPTMLKMLEAGFDVVVASAHHPEGRVENVPHYRLLLSRGVSRLYRVILGCDLYTYTGLLRVYRAEVIHAVRGTLRNDDFLAVTETLVAALRRGYRVAEHPTLLRARTFGRSKAVIPRVIRHHLVYMAKLIAARARVPRA